MKTKVFLAVVFFIISYCYISQANLLSNEQSSIIRVTSNEWVNEIIVPFKEQKKTCRPREGKRFLVITLEPLKDGRFDNRELRLVDSSGNVYSYIAIDPSCKQNWVAYNVEKSPLTTRNISYHVTYENSKIVDLEPTTESGKVDFKLTSNGASLSSKNENYNPFSWTGSGAKFKVLFEVREGTRGFKLKYKDLESVPIKFS